MQERLPKLAAVSGNRNGRDGEIRTRDLTHPKRARYQAAPRPVSLNLVLQKNIVKLARKHKIHLCFLVTLLRPPFGFLFEERQQFAEF